MKHVLLALCVSLSMSCDKAPDIDESKYPSSPKDSAKVAVKSTGDGDKVSLRMKPEAGIEQNTSLTMKTSGDMIPSMTMGMEMSSKVTKVEDDGKYVVVLTIDDASMDAPGAGELGDILRGVEITQTMTPRGDIESFSFSGGGMAGLEDLVDKSLGGVQFSLPEDKVGKGASWTVRSLEEQNGMRVYQTITFTVVSVKGNEVKLEMDLDQRAKNQTIPGGADLEYLHTEGDGNMVLDLTKPIPLSAKIHGDMKMKVSMGGDSQKANMSFDIDLTTK